ncbi:MAG: GTPase RsgA [Bacilli bacterium]|nr:GTPase RsgA [Bacilli bacterium]
MTKCVGCGAILQDVDVSKEGYTRNLDNELCERCFKIRHYNEYKFVDKSNDYYLDIIKRIEKTNDLVVLVTDFLNTSSLNDLDIKNPILLVLAKRDLIPRHLDENKLLNSIKTDLDIVDKVIVGSKNNYNLDLLFSKINKYKTSKNVYVAGYTNAGKSTLINKLVKNYGENDTTITTSILPSTTLDLIDVKINDDLIIVDTPGLLDEGSIILNSEGDLLNKILPKREIKPSVIQVKVDQTILVSDVFRIDVTKGTNLIFYISNDLKLERLYKETARLRELFMTEFDVKAGSDIVIKGLGFIKSTSDCNVKIYIDKNVNVSVRTSII